MIKPYVNKVVIASLIFSSMTSSIGRAQIKWEGAPAHTEHIGRQSFLPVELRQLAHAKLWYLRYDYLRKHGIKIPAEGIANKQFADWYLSLNAYQNPGPQDRPEMFTEKKKTAYADYYGGEGNHGVRGSGRATLNGFIQHKGNLTPMVPEENRDPNMNGAQQLIDGMEEAIWSEILGNEFKYGANDTLDVIWTGNYARHSSGQIYPRGLQGRNFAVRIAHFMLRPPQYSDAADLARVKSIMPNLVDALPYPDDKKPSDRGEALRVGLLELTSREAHTQAEYYAKRLYFGSDSPSNLTISGERKDLTMHSAFLGYSKIYRKLSDGMIPFGTIDEVLLTFKELQESLSKTLPPDLLPYLPSQDEFISHFKRVYERDVRTEMIRLTGIPNELVEVMQNSNSFKKLGDVLLRISRAGNEEKVMLDMDSIKFTDRYQLNKMLAGLGSNRFASARELEISLESWIPDNTNLRHDLAVAYFSVRKEAELRGQERGISADAINTYFKEAAQIRNQDRVDLVLNHARVSKFWSVADQSIQSGDGTIAEHFIQDMVDRNTFNFKDVAPFQVVVKQTRKPAEGLIVREVYDALKGKYATIVRVNVANGEGYLNGEKFSADDLSQSSLKVADRITNASRSGDYLEFSFEDARGIDLSGAKVMRINDLSKILRENGASVRSCESIFKRSAS